LAALADTRRSKLHEFYEALNRRDVTTVIGVLGPDAEWHGREEDLSQAPVTDYEGARRRLDTMLDAFDEHGTEMFELAEVGPGHVLAVVGHRARGRASGAVTERIEFHLWTFDGEKVLRLQEFTDRDDALRAARP
jgi:ketosteroid isomerase-like protein